MTSRRRERAQSCEPADLSILSVLELPVPSFVFETGEGQILSMNPAARTLFGFTELDLIGTTKAPDLLGCDFKVDGASTGHRELTLPRHGRFDVVVGAARPSIGSTPSRSLVMLIPSIGGPMNLNETSRVVGWDHVAEKCRRFDGELLCVAIGVVGLPAVNSDFSRSAGDDVIAEIQHRLQLAGGENCVVERVGGTCFLVLHTSGGSDRLVVQRFLNVARRPIAGPHGLVALGVAAGVSVGHPRRPLLLFDRAVENLEHALARGAGSSEWDSTCRPQATPRDLAAPLLAAVERGAIVAAFQPVVSLLAGDIVEFEALARWPGHDDVSPRSMVELARDVGILGEFRTCVVLSAVELLRRHVGSAALRRVSIDVTAKEFVSPKFAATVLSAFAFAGIATSWLQIEITDAVAESDLASIASTIETLRCVGVRIALDGLRHGAVDWLALMKLDVDAIKVEAGLLASGLHDGRAGAALRSILELATEFGVDVIAKGVETIEQHEQLVSAGCLFAQGWLYGAPEVGEAVDTTFVSSVQSKWREVACSNRLPAVAAAIGGKLRALKAPPGVEAWLDVGILARRVETGGRYRPDSVSEHPRDRER
jgi:EAL domain-containing protein (putative c-di-GMP-specific phosphodiesterase class I)/GGDEF domain-containing protein